MPGCVVLKGVLSQGLKGTKFGLWMPVLKGGSARLWSELPETRGRSRRLTVVVPALATLPLQLPGDGRFSERSSQRLLTKFGATKPWLRWSHCVDVQVLPPDGEQKTPEIRRKPMLWPWAGTGTSLLSSLLPGAEAQLGEGPGRWAALSPGP